MPQVAPIVGVIASVASVAATVKGMSAAKKQAKAVESQGEQAEAATKAHNEAVLANMTGQSSQLNQFMAGINTATRNYTLQKGVQAMLASGEMGFEKLLQAADFAGQGLDLRTEQAQEGLDLMGRQQREQRTFKQLSMLMERDQFLKESEAALSLRHNELAAQVENTVNVARNEASRVIETTAAKQAQIAYEDQRDQDQHLAKQTVRAMEQRSGLGKIVAAQAASGLSGGAMSAVARLRRNDAIMQMADDRELKISRGLHVLASRVADQDSFRALKGLQLGLDRATEAADLEMTRLSTERELGFRKLTAQGEMGLQEMVMGHNQQAQSATLQARQDIERATFQTNQALAEQYMTFEHGIRASAYETQVKIGDLDFNYGIETAKRALEDGFRMENAQTDMEHNVSIMGIRNRYDADIAGIKAGGEIWQGVAGMSSSLFDLSKNLAGTGWFASTPINYGTPYGATGTGMGPIVGSTSSGGTGMLGGGV